MTFELIVLFIEFLSGNLTYDATVHRKVVKKNSLKNETGLSESTFYFAVRFWESPKLIVILHQVTFVSQSVFESLI